MLEPYCYCIVISVIDVIFSGLAIGLSVGAAVVLTVILTVAIILKR